MLRLECNAVSLYFGAPLLHYWPFLLSPNRQQACCWLLSFDTSELWLLYIKRQLNETESCLFFFTLPSLHTENFPPANNWKPTTGSPTPICHVSSRLVIYLSSHQGADIFQDFVSGWVHVCFLGSSYRQCLVIIKSNFGIILVPQIHFTSLLLCWVGSSNFVSRHF